MSINNDNITQEQKDMIDSVNDSLANPTSTNDEHLSLAVKMENMYKGTVNIGTEEITGEDLNTPTLKLIQNNTNNIENKRIGWFYRTDTKEQMIDLDVNLVYMTTTEMENFNKTGMEKVKVYYGYYAGTKEPFKIFLRGWNLESHRFLQTEIVMYKNRYKVPMFALTLHLSSKIKSGVIKKTGGDYSISQIVFTVLKNPRDPNNAIPVIEMNPERISFLFESAERFKGLVVAGDAQKDDSEEVPTHTDENMNF